MTIREDHDQRVQQYAENHTPGMLAIMLVQLENRVAVLEASRRLIEEERDDAIEAMRDARESLKQMEKLLDELKGLIGQPSSLPHEELPDALVTFSL